MKKIKMKNIFIFVSVWILLMVLTGCDMSERTISPTDEYPTYIYEETEIWTAEPIHTSENYERLVTTPDQAIEIALEWKENENGINLLDSHWVWRVVYDIPNGVWVVTFFPKGEGILDGSWDYVISDSTGEVVDIWFAG